MSPDDLRRMAEQFDAEAVELALAGDVGNGALKMRDAIRLRALADEAERLQGLRGGKRSVNVHTDVTSMQLARRGRAIAASKADNALKLAITQDSRWGSLRVYAKKRLKISPGSLTAYMQDRPCPAAVDRKIREDFPALLWNWPKGLTD